MAFVGGPDVALKQKAADIVLTTLVVAFSPVLKFAARHRPALPMLQRTCDRLGFQIRATHYYEPTYREADLPPDTSRPRSLPGIDMNESGQLAMLGRLDYGEELLAIPMEKRSNTEFAYHNDMCEEGVAELLYSMVRHWRPQRIVEIGSGNSTLVTRLAVAASNAEAPYAPKHVCIEPYEMPWLESTGVTVVRERVEHVGLDLFRELQAGDLLFIDSSHVIRPWGDVLREILEILPSLAPGVFISIDDIFTPMDYPENWLRSERRLWNEQYMLEAFLSFNRDFEIVCAPMWLKQHHPDELHRVCPVLARSPHRSPGVLWLRRVRPEAL